MPAPVLDERRVALLLLLREGERRLRLRRLFVGLIDARLLGSDLCVDIGHVGLGLIDLRGCLIDLRPKVAIVEPHQDGAGFDQLIVRHRHIDDGGADLRADRDRAGIDEGVVGRFIAAGIEPIGHRPDDGRDDQRRDDKNLPPPPAHAVEPRLRFAGFADRGLDVVSGRSVQAVFGVGALIHVTSQDKRPARQAGSSSISPCAAPLKSLPAFALPAKGSRHQSGGRG